ncbi:hypothetical protein LINPERPRIM_LOCUS39396, partial [Linum perenne]
QLSLSLSSSSRPLFFSSSSSHHHIGRRPPLPRCHLVPTPAKRHADLRPQHRQQPRESSPAIQLEFHLPHPDFRSSSSFSVDLMSLI